MKIKKRVLVSSILLAVLGCSGLVALSPTKNNNENIALEATSSFKNENSERATTINPDIYQFEISVDRLTSDENISIQLPDKIVEQIESGYLIINDVYSDSVNVKTYNHYVGWDDKRFVEDDKSIVDPDQPIYGYWEAYWTVKDYYSWEDLSIEGYRYNDGVIELNKYYSVITDELDEEITTHERHTGPWGNYSFVEDPFMSPPTITRNSIVETNKEFVTVTVEYEFNEEHLQGNTLYQINNDQFK